MDQLAKMMPQNMPTGSAVASSGGPVVPNPSTGGRRRRGRKSRGRKSRGRKSRGRKSRGRKSRR